jgi:hypothetical protein
MPEGCTLPPPPRGPAPRRAAPPAERGVSRRRGYIDLEYRPLAHAVARQSVRRSALPQKSAGVALQGIAATPYLRVIARRVLFDGSASISCPSHDVTGISMWLWAPLRTLVTPADLG